MTNQVSENTARGPIKLRVSPRPGLRGSLKQQNRRLRGIETSLRKAIVGTQQEARKIEYVLKIVQDTLDGKRLFDDTVIVHIRGLERWSRQASHWAQFARHCMNDMLPPDWPMHNSVNKPGQAPSVGLSATGGMPESRVSGSAPLDVLSQAAAIAQSARTGFGESGIDWSRDPLTEREAKIRKLWIKKQHNTILKTIHFRIVQGELERSGKKPAADFLTGYAEAKLIEERERAQSASDEMADLAERVDNDDVEYTDDDDFGDDE